MGTYISHLHPNLRSPIPLDCNEEWNIADLKKQIDGWTYTESAPSRCALMSNYFMAIALTELEAGAKHDDWLYSLLPRRFK